MRGVRGGVEKLSVESGLLAMLSGVVTDEACAPLIESDCPAPSTGASPHEWLSILEGTPGMVPPEMSDLVRRLRDSDLSQSEAMEAFVTGMIIHTRVGQDVPYRCELIMKLRPFDKTYLYSSDDVHSFLRWACGNLPKKAQVYYNHKMKKDPPTIVDMVNMAAADFTFGRLFRNPFYSEATVAVMSAMCHAVIKCVENDTEAYRELKLLTKSKPDPHLLRWAYRCLRQYSKLWPLPHLSSREAAWANLGNEILAVPASPPPLAESVGASPV